MTDRINIIGELDAIKARLDTLESLIDRARTVPTPPTPQYRLTDDAFFDMATGGANPFHGTPPGGHKDLGWRLDNPITPVAIIAAAGLIGWALWSLLT